MRNVRVVSFVDHVIEAGFKRIPPREEVVMQYDLLFPYIMHYHRDDLAIANIERLAEHVGVNTDRQFLLGISWVFPKEEPVKTAPAAKEPEAKQPEEKPKAPEPAPPAMEVKVEGDSVSMRPVAPSDFNMPTPTVDVSGKIMEEPAQEKRKKGRR